MKIWLSDSWDVLKRGYIDLWYKLRCTLVHWNRTLKKDLEKAFSAMKSTDPINEQRISLNTATSLSQYLSELLNVLTLNDSLLKEVSRGKHNK